MGNKSDNPHTGSSFDDFLAEEGILESCTETAKERVRQMEEDDKITEVPASPAP